MTQSKRTKAQTTTTGPKKGSNEKKSKTANTIPQFAVEAEERSFWKDHDSADFVDWKDAESIVLPSLKPSTTTISLRLPNALLSNIKVLANKNDVPYQSLMKVYLAERVAKERGDKPL